MFGLNARRFRKSLAILTSVGMSRATATAGVAAATTVWTFAATLAGILAGIASALPAGQWQAPFSRRSDFTLAGSGGGPAARLLGVTVAACTAAALLLHLAHPRSTGAAAPSRAPSARAGKKRTRVTGAAVRRIAATVLGVAIIVQIGVCSIPSRKRWC